MATRLQVVWHRWKEWEAKRWKGWCVCVCVSVCACAWASQYGVEICAGAYMLNPLESL